ncbi:excisionase [Escherichia coli]|uniref:excisionase n=1 Tax=Escherichia coli TaxID=562 RepID=UPI0035C681AB
MSISPLFRWPNSVCHYTPAMKQGRLWRVHEDAELVGELVTPVIKKSDSIILQRILSNGSQTT